MDLSTSIDSLPNTSTITIRRLKSLGINTYWDLLNYFPHRYEDYSVISKINQLQEGKTATAIGQIIDSKYQMTRTGLRIQKFIVQDETGSIELNWYNQPYLLTLLKKGMSISVAGEIKRFGRKMVMNPKEYEIISFDISNHRNDLKHTGRFIPVYSETRGLSSKTIRQKEFYLLHYFCADRLKSSIHEIFPADFISNNNLIDEQTAYQNIHFPNSSGILEKARERISFDELFILQFTLKLVRKEWEQETVGNQFKISGKTKIELNNFIKNLPFSLTRAQEKATDEILSDLILERPMNRFLQGEVGSGKTVVAAIACHLSYLSGFQSLFMAPTEILAEQHYKTLRDLFNLNSKIPKICLVTGSTKPEKKELEKADIIIGTHALIQKNMKFRKVGFVVVDEQHRFGVAQRAELKSKGMNPHLLTMTATPIPRTVMLTLYDELDLSVLDQMPNGRLPIKTFFVPKEKRASCYEWIKEQINTKNAQVYIICPLIEESEVETLSSIKAVKKEHEYLKNQIFTHFSVGLLHGKLNAKEKNKVMNDFKKKKYNILVSTPVVEVGIDVPTATIMIIEGGERFGLAQLHQLRGRVGRGEKQSYCFVFSEKADAQISERLVFFTKTQDGNSLAQKDLEMRGPGNLYGKEQHGYIELKLASLSNYPLIEKTKRAVEYFMIDCDLKEYPELKKRVEKLKVKQISRD